MRLYGRGILMTRWTIHELDRKVRKSASRGTGAHRLLTLKAWIGHLLVVLERQTSVVYSTVYKRSGNDDKAVKQSVSRSQMDNAGHLLLPTVTHVVGTRFKLCFQAIQGDILVANVQINDQNIISSWSNSWLTWHYVYKPQKWHCERGSCWSLM